MIFPIAYKASTEVKVMRKQKYCLIFDEMEQGIIYEV